MKENAEITVFITQEKTNLKKLFGAHKFKEPTEKIMRQIDEELYDI